MSLMDRETITIKRYAAGRYVGGNYVAGDDTILPDIKCNMQPLGGNELLRLPEGDREKDVQKIYTTTEILNSDIIIRDKTNIKYEVFKVYDNSANDPPHYKAILVSLKNQ